MSKSTDAGATWSLPRVLSGKTGNARNPAIAIDNANTVYVVWQDNEPGNDEIYLKKSKDGGSTWTRKHISYNTGQSRHPAAQHGKNKGLHGTKVHQSSACADEQVLAVRTHISSFFLFGVLSATGGG